MKTILGFAFALVLAGCQPIYTNYDYDKDADFNSFLTYAWLEKDESAPQDAKQAQMQNPLVAQRIQRDIDTQLDKKGLRKVQAQSDLLVTYYLGSKATTEISRTGYGRLGMGNTTVRDINEGTIIIDLVNAQTNNLVWRGIADSAARDDAPPEQINQTIADAIVKLFKKYPPK